MRLIDEIPADVLALVRDKPVAEVGFACGPSFVAGKVERYAPETVSLATAMDWLEQYRDHLKAAHVGFADKSVLWLRGGHFSRYDQESAHKLPRAGVTVRHPRSR